MPLTEREQRALRAIDHALADEDPTLALFLERPLPQRTRPDRRVVRWTWLYIGVAVMLLVFGLLLWSPGLQFLGLLLLAAIPAAVWCIARVLRRSPDLP